LGIDIKKKPTEFYFSRTVQMTL